MGLVKEIQQYINKKQTATIKKHSFIAGSMNAGISTYYVIPKGMVPKTDERNGAKNG